MFKITICIIGPTYNKSLADNCEAWSENTGKGACAKGNTQPAEMSELWLEQLIAIDAIHVLQEMLQLSPDKSSVVQMM